MRASSKTATPTSGPELNGSGFLISGAFRWKENDMIRKAERSETGSPNTIVEVGEVRFGHDPFPVIAGPCVIESEAQITETAEVVAAAGASCRRCFHHDISSFSNSPCNRSRCDAA